MNQKDFAKAFAIFVGAIMIFSAFAGFIMRSGDSGQSGGETTTIENTPLSTFGVNGQLVDMSLSNLGDLLLMCPEDTDFAYWIEMNASKNLTDAARGAIPSLYPPAAGLIYSEGQYPTEVKRTGAAFFNASWTEFHWVKPFSYDYQGLVIPYYGFNIIPSSSDYYRVFGRPVLFGPQDGIKQVLDIISGGLPTDRLTFAFDEVGADFQMAGLGSKGGKSQAPLGGDYEEFYFGLTETDHGFDLLARYFLPTGQSSGRINELASKYGLADASDANVLTVSGKIAPDKVAEVLTAFIAP